MKDKGIQKPFIQEIITDDPAYDNYYGLRKLIRDYLVKLNVPFYDPCCPAASETGIFPQRFNAITGEEEVFDGTDWVSETVAEGEFTTTTTTTTAAPTTTTTTAAPSTTTTTTT